MTYRSESRGLMYTAPPSGDEDERTGDSKATAEDRAVEHTDGETEDERPTPELEPTSATTDANWTGTVPADD